MMCQIYGWELVIPLIVSNLYSPCDSGMAMFSKSSHPSGPREQLSSRRGNPIWFKFVTRISSRVDQNLDLYNIWQTLSRSIHNSHHVRTSSLRIMEYTLIRLKNDNLLVASDNGSVQLAVKLLWPSPWRQISITMPMTCGTGSSVDSYTSQS